MVKRICQTSSNFGFYKEWIVFSTSVDVTVLNEIKFFLSFIWERMLTMFWLVFVPIKYFLQWKFLCNSFCWFNFQFRSDGDRVYVHSSRNNFIKYHWIVFTKHHFVTTYTPLSEKKRSFIVFQNFLDPLTLIISSLQKYSFLVIKEGLYRNSFLFIVIPIKFTYFSDTSSSFKNATCATHVNFYSRKYFIWLSNCFFIRAW